MKPPTIYIKQQTPTVGGVNVDRLMKNLDDAGRKVDFDGHHLTIDARRDPKTFTPGVNKAVHLKLMSQGYSVACSSCRHMHEADHRGSDRCDKKCGGPPAGMDFPHFSGPISAQDFSKFCFACGAQATSLITRPTWSKSFGACDAHVSMVEGRHQLIDKIGG